MGTAVRSQWARALQSDHYNAIYDLWKSVSGTDVPRNANCASCILTLLTDVGRAYFAQKEAEERVQLSKAKTTAQRSVKVRAKK